MVIGGGEGVLENVRGCVCHDGLPVHKVGAERIDDLFAGPENGIEAAGDDEMLRWHIAENHAGQIEVGLGLDDGNRCLLPAQQSGDAERGEQG